MPARNTADVTAMVNKVLDYERVENLGTGWFDQGVFIASEDWGAFAEETHDHVIADNFQPAGVTCYTIYERLGGSTADIFTNLNAGREVCIYSGHGSSGSWGCQPPLASVAAWLKSRTARAKARGVKAAACSSNCGRISSKM